MKTETCTAKESNHICLCEEDISYCRLREILGKLSDEL